MPQHPARDWQTVAEDIVCDGVSADLIYHTTEHRYKLLIWRPDLDAYEPREISAADVAALGVSHE